MKTYSSKSLNKEQSDRIFERVERDAAAMNRNISMLERIMEKELQDNDQHMKNVHTAFNGTPTLLRNKYIDCLNHSRKDKHKEHVTWSMITEMTDSYDSVFKHYVDNAPLYVRCPICGTKFAQRLTERKIAKYRCNKCGGIFLWNSEVTPKNRRFSSAWHYFKLCIKSLLADKTNNMTSL